MNKLINKIIQLGINLCEAKELEYYMTECQNPLTGYKYKKINYLHGEDISDIEFINDILERLFRNNTIDILEIIQLEKIHNEL